MNFITDWLDRKRAEAEDRDRLADKRILSARMIELHVMNTTVLRRLERS